VLYYHSWSLRALPGSSR